MTPYQINLAVQSYLSTSWTATPILTDNASSTLQPPFISVYFKPAGVEGIEIKGATIRVGVLIINVYTKKGVGIAEALTYGSMLEALFDHKVITSQHGRVICENEFMQPYTENIGLDTDLQAYHVKTVVPFCVINN